jgi:hypothetical protein
MVEEGVVEASVANKAPATPATPAPVSSGGDVLVTYIRGGSYSIEGHRFNDERPSDLVSASLANVLLSTGSFVRASAVEQQNYRSNKK